MIDTTELIARLRAAADVAEAGDKIEWAETMREAARQLRATLPAEPQSSLRTIVEYHDDPVWQPMSVLDLLPALILASGGRLMLDNFDAKYIDARIDMRGGRVLLKEGNCRDRKPRYIVASAETVNANKETGDE